MTILLSQAVRVGGAVLAAGTTQTLAADLEADLVTRKMATYTVAPMKSTVPLFGENDPVTGGVAFTAGGEDITSKMGGGGGSIRHIANKCAFPTTKNPGLTTQMSRSAHTSLSDVAGVQLVYPNFTLAPGVETAVGATADMTASIEKLDGTIVQVTFGGISTGTAPDGGLLISDMVAVNLRRGESFFVRTWRTCSAGFIYGAFQQVSVTPSDGITAGSATTTGEGFRYGTIGSTTDTTMTPGAFSSAGNFMYRPVVIAGMSSRPAVVNYGDSKSLGQGDTSNTVVTGIGNFARSFDGLCANSIFGIGSEQLQNLTSHATYSATALNNRKTLHKYFTHVVCNLGINDIGAGGRTAVQFLTDLDIFCGLFEMPVWMTTVPVRGGTSSDSWTTTANQTVHSSNAQRVIANDAIRTRSAVSTGLGATKISGHFDYADAVENGRNSGIWKASTKPWTADGTHETQWGYMQIAASGVIDPRVFGI